MLRFFRRSSAGINEVEVKPAREENVVDTVSHTARTDSCSHSQGIEERDSLDKSEQQTREKHEQDSQEDDSELARETAAMSLSEPASESRQSNERCDHPKRKHIRHDMTLSSSSSDDELGEILRGGAWATPSATSTSTLFRRRIDASPCKKHRGVTRPFLNFEKMRQSRFSTGFRRVPNPRGKESRVYSLKLSHGLKSSNARVTPISLCPPKDESPYAFLALQHLPTQMDVVPCLH
ncbi:uncharacterized protein LOC134180044 [Corticium candelabrum]|uniref:uncharacterized protein LOC134180044 n=1 Tax=Corticium candelabrum TaxID=121492 RepID=UPI002E26359D|nr:uncharacterized protein LOC134180044 [Corticium candelabrum]XP_062503101.1 uncharacterized protein LOC134180044 [Corticium candelabrum]